MSDLQSVDEVKRYEFAWELKGYDCGPQKIRSPTFTLNFQVTDWYIELDFSKLKNVRSSVDFHLQRVMDIGPPAITLDVNVTVKIKDHVILSDVVAAKVFGTRLSSYDLVIDFPCQKLESEDKFCWLTFKTLSINVEMTSPKKTAPDIPKKYVYSPATLDKFRKGLKEVLEGEYNHDLVLKVTGEEFRVHKYMLNARWPSLLKALEIKQISGKKETREFSAIPPAILKLFLQFVYYGDLSFMYKLETIDEGVAVFECARKFNFCRLNDKIIQLSPKCSCSQMFQSYRTSFHLTFTNVTSTNTGMGDFKTCQIPLKPRLLPPVNGVKTEKKLEEFYQHIKFLDLRLYVNKGVLGYNWLMFSIVLGKLPEAHNVTIKCKLYVVGKDKLNYLLSEQNLEFDKQTEVSFTTPLSGDKVLKRYKRISEPVITWRELIDKDNKFMWERKVKKGNGEEIEENDLHFRFELKFGDGEFTHTMTHDEIEAKFIEYDDKIVEDFEKLYSSQEFTNIQVTAGGRTVKAHKAVLAARSKQLNDLIRKNPNSETLLLSIKPDILQWFIHYLYTGQMHEDPDRKDDFIALADRFNLDCLKEVLTRQSEETDTEMTE